MTSSSDEPSKIIGDANKDFINIDIEEEDGYYDENYSDELQTNKHLSAGVFPSIFDNKYNDLKQSESQYIDSDTGTTIWSAKLRKKFYSINIFLMDTLQRFIIRYNLFFRGLYWN